MIREGESGSGFAISLGELSVKRASRWVGCVAFILFFLGMSAVAYGEAQEKQERAVVVMLVPLSGDLGAVGRQLVDAAKMAGDDVGVAIESIDEGESVEEMLAALGTLEGREDVAAVIGPIRRRHGPPAGRQAQRMGIPLMVFSSQSGVERAGDRVFRARPDAAEQSKRVATYLVEEASIEKIAIMAPRSDHGDQVLSALVEAVVSAGGVVEAMTRYEPDTTDFRIPLQVLVGRRFHVGRGRSLSGFSVDRFGTVALRRQPEVGFDALIIADHHEVVARILPFLPRVGIQTGAGGEGQAVQLVGLSGWRGDGLQRAGDHGLGAIFFDTYGGETEGGQPEEFARNFKDYAGRSATTPEAEIYDLVAMIGSGLRARRPGESFAQAALARLREPQNYPGVSGSWSFDENGAPVRYMRPYRVVDGGRWVPDGGANR